MSLAINQSHLSFASLPSSSPHPTTLLSPRATLIIRAAKISFHARKSVHFKCKMFSDPDPSFPRDVVEMNELKNESVCEKSRGARSVVHREDRGDETNLRVARFSLFSTRENPRGSRRYIREFFRPPPFVPSFRRTSVSEASFRPLNVNRGCKSNYAIIDIRLHSRMRLFTAE